ncbi:MAG: hypothetical protein GX947_04285 [Tissierellia bacterium]|nr:hypothetical protein [Tissierellia bacterium]
MSKMVMPRSIHQALYKYLPEAWGDFYDRDSRISYTMLVKYWNSTNLENINKKRIISEVNNEVKQFQNRGGRVQGFGNVTPSEYAVLTPKGADNPEIPDIISHISPLTFVCNKCHSVTSFNSSEAYLKNRSNRYCKKDNCGGELKQIGLVYACTCGWAGPMYPNKCNVDGHGIKYLKYWPGEFVFNCSRDGNKVQMVKRCPDCNKTLMPRNTSSGDVFIPFNFTLIELLNDDVENFIIENENAPFIVISNWLDKIDDPEYYKFVRSSFEDDEDSNDKDEQYNILLQELLSHGLPEVQAIQIARNTTNKTDPNVKRNNLIEEVRPLIFSNHLTSEYNLQKLAISLVEYKTIVDSKVKITIEEGIERAMAQNSIFNPNEYLDVFDRFGFSKIEACGEIPMVNCVYGYTRRESDPSTINGEQLTLRALREESHGVKNVYGVRLTTEGILFELDRARVIQWLIKNEVLDENVAPDIGNEEDLKLWFLNNVDLSAINTFSRIDSDKYKYTSYVYNLIHSLSHALIKESEEFSGLDKNSLAEYLFPSVPAFFIYCQNTQGTSLGSLFSLYSSVLSKWVNKANESMNKCIFDPICIEGKRNDMKSNVQAGLNNDSGDIACLGCLYINEISCRHFNKDLNRRYITGYTDLANKKTYGYWEV